MTFCPTRQELETIPITCDIGTCRQAQVGMTDFYEHLKQVHRYPDEDAGIHSSRAAHQAIREADPEWPIFQRLYDKFM